MDNLLLEVGIIFAALAGVKHLSDRCNKSVIPFYLVAGILLNQYVLGRAGLPHVTESEFVQISAELGVVFLLFFLGLEFNLDRLISAYKKITKIGTLDLIINFGVGFLFGFILFRDILPAILVAGIVYMSSSAIITKSLIDLGWIANDEAEPMLGTLIYEDIFIAVYLAVISALLLGPGGGILPAVRSTAVALGFMLVLLLLVYFATGFFRRLVEVDSNESLILRILGTTVLIGGAGLALGVSEAVAGFFVGMAFSNTGYTTKIENLLEPVRDVFAALFFFWIGLVTDPTAFTNAAVPIGIAILASTPTKLASGYWSGKIYNLNTRRSWRVGLGMTTRGEFSLIIATLTLSGAGVGITEPVAESIYAFSVGYVLLMSVLGTSLMEHSELLGRGFRD